MYICIVKFNNYIYFFNEEHLNFLRLSKRKTSESSFLEWRQENARGLQDQCSLCANKGDKFTKDKHPLNINGDKLTSLKCGYKQTSQYM